MKANRKAFLEHSMWDMKLAHGLFVPRIHMLHTKARAIKELQGAKKKRINMEKILLKHKRIFQQSYGLRLRKNRDIGQKIHEQIQYGFDLANWWMLDHAN